MASYKKQYTATRKALLELLEWSTSGARYQNCNPYMIPVIKESLKTIAEIDGLKDYLSVELDTAKYNKE